MLQEPRCSGFRVRVWGVHGLGFRAQEQMVGCLGTLNFGRRFKICEKSIRVTSDVGLYVGHHNSGRDRICQ